MTSMPQQVLLRLPDALAARFAQVVAPRQRSRFLIDLLSRELDRESHELVLAAKRLNALDAQDASLTVQTDDWLRAGLAADASDDGFDTAIFTQQFAAAQQAPKP